MSSARAQANHRLYLAKIQLAAWESALADEDVAAVTLTQAFLPAVRTHLINAYGWFLLALSGSEAPVGGPPRRCAELPAVPPGKSMPGEIREFQHLEVDGWLAQLLAESDLPVASARSKGNLAVSHPGPQGPGTALEWIHQLETLFERMSDSLDEC